MNKAINFTNKDLDIISMALIDNAVIGRLNKYEYKLAWNILERLYEHITLSKTDLVLICDSLNRYAIKYISERLEISECERIYNFILESAKNEYHRI